MREEDIAHIARAVAEALSLEIHVDEKSVRTSQGGTQEETAPALGGLGDLGDLGSAALRKISPLCHPCNGKVLDEFLRVTRARVAVGKAGPRPLTESYLRFLADYARSKDTVTKEVPEAWLEKCGLWGICSQAEDKQTHLTRPDLGRSLTVESLQELKRRYPEPVQVLIVLSDGLSTDALLCNYEEILPPLLKGLRTMNLTVAEPFFLKHGRVKAQDVIGEAVDCDVVVMLIGERPGLGQSESMSCYAVYRPNRQTLESERTVISNIHAGGMPPVEGAAVIVDLVVRMLKYQASGISLNKAQEQDPQGSYTR